MLSCSGLGNPICQEGAYMKILITTDLYTTATNGVVTSVRNLFEELLERGHDVRILTLSEKARSYRKDRVYYIRSMPLWVYQDVRMPLAYHHKLINELIEWKPDVIHSQCEIFTMQYAMQISEKTNAPIVHTYHTMYEQYVGYVIPVKRLGRWVVRYLTHKRLENVSKVIVPTDKVKQVLEGYALDKQICIVPSGICLEQHKKRISEEERKAGRKELGIRDNQHVLINLGRLGTEKNIGELLDFFARVLVDEPNMVFLIVGDGPAREELEEKAKELGIKEKVIFTGMVNPLEVQKYYQLGDVFVSASTSETQGLTYIEAAANGLPLLCRKDPCLDCVIDEGENGYEYANEEEFLEAIEQMVRDENWLKNAGKYSEEKVAVFDKEVFAEHVETIYRSVQMVG